MILAVAAQDKRHGRSCYDNFDAVMGNRFADNIRTMHLSVGKLLHSEIMPSDKVHGCGKGSISADHLQSPA